MKNNKDAASYDKLVYN